MELLSFSHMVSRLSWVRKAIMNTPGIRQFACRFFAEDLESALLILRKLNALGIKGTLSYAGNHQRNTSEITAATESALECLRRIHAEGLDSHISIKLTCLGLDVGMDLCRANVQRILEQARVLRSFVRIDMEESAYVDATLELFEEMRDAYGRDTVGIVIQSYLCKRQADLKRLIDGGSRIRLVKGGYKESPRVVCTTADEILTAFRRDIEKLLTHGRFPAIATHDQEAIVLTRDCARKAGRSKSEFEFQMMNGLQIRLRQQLVRDGYTLRCYVPYGKWWQTLITPRFILKVARILMRDQISG
jgi:proline dehydrogenase